MFAALDLGTNNCRLLVAVPTPGGFAVIDSFSRIVRLGEGLHATGRLSMAAIDRTLAALGVCAHKMRRRKATRVRCVATEACRHAINGADLLERAEREAGVTLEVIDCREEALLAMHGCGPLLDPSIRHAVVFDIGGGSSEVLWLELDRGGRLRLVDSTSLPWGVVRMAEHFGGETVTEESYEAMVAVIREHLAAFDERHGIRRRFEAGEAQMLGTSGTVTTIAGVHLCLPRYQRQRVDGQMMNMAEVADVVARLRCMDYEERARHPCIGPERADLVLPGCAIMEGICRDWPVPHMRVADRGLREGILLNLMAGEPGRVRETTS